MNFPNNTLVVIADGTQANLYRNTANDGSLSLKSAGNVTPKSLESDGPAGSTPAEMSPREIDEATFAKQLAEHLFKQAHAKKYSSLVLAADPQTLGQIRPSLHKEVQDKIILELDKSLTNSPVSDIERSLAS